MSGSAVHAGAGPHSACTESRSEGRRRSSAGVCLGVCGSEMAHTYMGVYLGRADRCVAEQFLDAPEIGTSLEEMSGERVPEGVRRALRESLPAQRVGQDAANVGAVQRAAADAREEPIAGAVAG